MNKRRRIFFIIFGAYHVLLVSFALYIETQKEDLGLLYGLYSKISMMRNGAILGLLLFLVDFIWTWFENRAAEKSKDIMTHENNTLKAKLYDIQNSAKAEGPLTTTTKEKSL
jgi:hypothetical protein